MKILLDKDKLETDHCRIKFLRNTIRKEYTMINSEVK